MGLKDEPDVISHKRWEEHSGSQSRSGTAERPQPNVAGLEKGRKINVMERRWKAGVSTWKVR